MTATHAIQFQQAEHSGPIGCFSERSTIHLVQTLYGALNASSVISVADRVRRIEEGGTFIRSASDPPNAGFKSALEKTAKISVICCEREAATICSNVAPIISYVRFGGLFQKTATFQISLENRWR